MPDASRFPAEQLGQGVQCLIDVIQDAGIIWHDGKNHNKPPVVIAWTPGLHAIIDETLSLKRHHVAGTLFLFGNMKGRSTRKAAGKSCLMTGCGTVSKRRKLAGKRLSDSACKTAALLG